MKRQICVVAYVANRPDYSDSRKPSYWHLAVVKNCTAVVGALVKDKDNFVKVLTSAQSDSSFVRNIKRTSPDVLLTGVSLEITTQVAKSVAGSDTLILFTDTDYEKENPISDEVDVGRSVTDACVNSCVKHLIYSTQMHVYACIGLRCDACDAKAHIADYITAADIKETLVCIPFLYEDFLAGGALTPRKTTRTDTYKIVAPMGYIPMDTIALEDVALCFRNLVANPTNWSGKTLSLSGDKMTIQEYAQMLTDNVYPKIVKDAQVTPEEFIDYNEWDGAEDMANYFDYLTRGVQRNNMNSTMSLVSEIACFYDWAKANAKKVVAALEV
uniref:nmrA-like family domain-containing protein 1 n=1 Tax=Ciona intestinalis TaxID=7719 RepID=UPI0002B8DCB3|nr:nmrA-like family domain-containing protein 1 [Ciona intestinalis]|eukprot:XP_004226527.1 nmrA-like family domain-containing protein 1 [Ciona intestinalis]